jgi:hypothetical protein
LFPECFRKRLDYAYPDDRALVTDLDYESVLQELHGLINQDVMVVLFDAVTRHPVASLYGPLRAAEAGKPVNVAPHGPVIEGDGTMIFGVGVTGAAQPEPVMGRFAISEVGFGSARQFEDGDGTILTFRVGPILYLVTVRRN